MFERFRLPIGWKELLLRTGKAMQADNAVGLAAQLGFYFFLALFPALLFLVALASFFPLENVMDRLVHALSGVAPQAMLDLLRDQIQQISEGRHGGLLTMGILGALWSASAAMVALTDALNRAYGVEESRPWWRVRLTAIGLTLALALFVLVSFGLVVAGPQLARAIAEQARLGAAFEWTWLILQWPVVFALVATAIGLVYYFGPDVKQDWAWLTPASLAATLLWLLASLGFRFYIVNFGAYTETYGAIGAVIVLMLWFYISGLALIAGAEINAVIEHASPEGKAPGERAPGERAAGKQRELEHAAPLPPPSRALSASAAPARRTGRVERGRLWASDFLIGGLVLVAELALIVRARFRRQRQ